VISNISNLDQITLNGNIIERVSEYRYLGQMVSFENKTEKSSKSEGQMSGRPSGLKNISLKVN